MTLAAEVENIPTTAEIAIAAIAFIKADELFRALRREKASKPDVHRASAEMARARRRLALLCARYERSALAIRVDTLDI